MRKRLAIPAVAKLRKGIEVLDRSSEIQRAKRAREAGSPSWSSENVAHDDSGALAIVSFAHTAFAADSPAFDRKTDVVYGRKWGMALTMDVFTPRDNPNYSEHGPAIVWVVSGGWFSAHEAISIPPDRGVSQARIHGLRRRARQPAAIHDSRSHPGHESGGAIHPLSCQGLSDRPRSHRRDGRLRRRPSLAHAREPPATRATRKPAIRSIRHRAASRPSAASSRPPISSTTASRAKTRSAAASCRASSPRSISRSRIRKTKVFRSITDEARIIELGRQISPVNHVSSDDPPTLIIHGDADKLVPIQQAEIFLDKLKAAGVETKLVVKKGAGHGWGDLLKKTSPLSPIGSMRI